MNCGTDEIVNTLEALGRMPFQPLGLHEVLHWKSVLDRARVLLDRIGRLGDHGGPSVDAVRLEALLADQTARVEAAFNRPVAVAASLGIMEERWLSTNPGKPLDNSPVLLLVFTPTDEYSAEDWAFRSTCTTFLVRYGVVENSLRSVRYLLLAAPAWYAAFTRDEVSTRDTFGVGTSAVTRMVTPVGDLDHEQYETLLGLWTPDALSDLLDLQWARESVLALTALERAERPSPL